MPNTAPYVLAVASHKGGTGRTTAALTLAWCWGQLGLPVCLVDADPVGAASLLALGPDGRCRWPNVAYRRGLPELGQVAESLIVVDCPALLEPLAEPVLRVTEGALLCCLPDPLTLRTIPAAAEALRKARLGNPRLELLGILIGMHDNRDGLQSAMLERLRQSHGGLLLEPPIPHQTDMRDWPLAPGAEPPVGPARDAYMALAHVLGPMVRRERGT